MQKLLLNSQAERYNNVKEQKPFTHIYHNIAPTLSIDAVYISKHQNNVTLFNSEVL